MFVHFDFDLTYRHRGKKAYFEWVGFYYYGYEQPVIFIIQNVSYLDFIDYCEQFISLLGLMVSHKESHTVLCVPTILTSENKEAERVENFILCIKIFHLIITDSF